MHPAHERHDQQRTIGERLADIAAAGIGTWRFLIIQASILVVWMVLNVIMLVGHWDPYPFILLNLALSFQAAFTGPLLLLAGNREQARDRDQAAHDHQVNQEALRLIRELHQRWDER